MNIENYAIAGAILVGLVNGVQLLLDRKWDSFIKFVIALVTGMTFGYFGWFGLPSLEIGLAVGISSSGFYKISQKLGGK